MEAVRPKTSVCAVWSLVLGIISITLCLNVLTAIPGLILGIIALIRTRKTPDFLKGKGLAIGGIVTSSVGLLILPVVIAIAVPSFMSYHQQARAYSGRAEEGESTLPYGDMDAGPEGTGESPVMIDGDGKPVVGWEPSSAGSGASSSSSYDMARLEEMRGRDAERRREETSQREEVAREEYDRKRREEAATARMAEAMPPPGQAESRDFHKVEVFYATDRKATGTESDNRRYGKERNREGPLSYGKTEVSIPLHHRMGIVERPRWYKLEFSEDPRKHVVILKLEEMAPATYFQELGEAAEDRPLQEALLFIHGFSVTFDEAVRRTAQMSFDLDFGGVALTYSWPADGALTAYVADHGNALWSFPHLSDFLVDLQEKTDLDRIHVIAHSMGTEVLGRALAKARDDGFRLELNNVILAAPDIDADVFREQILPKIRGTAQKLTMYASSGDTALKVSQELNGNDRLGLSGDLIKVLEGMDTVDATDIDTSMLGHAYYGSHRVVVEDLLNLIIKGLEPPDRKLVRGSKGQWSFLNLVQ